jgi:hypothetical protein
LVPALQSTEKEIRAVPNSSDVWDRPVRGDPAMFLPAITDFIKGTLEESLKKLVQPAGVIPATIFLLLSYS